MATNTKTTALLSSTTGEVKSLWSHLTEPDTHFDNVGWYKITFVTDEPTGIQLNSQLEKLHNQAKQDYISAGKDVRSENKSGGKKVDNEDDMMLDVEDRAEAAEELQGEEDAAVEDEDMMVNESQDENSSQEIDNSSIDMSDNDMYEALLEWE